MAELEKLTVPQLKAMLRERKLPVGGLKADLITRLQRAPGTLSPRLAQATILQGIPEPLPLLPPQIPAGPQPQYLVSPSYQEWLNILTGYTDPVLKAELRHHGYDATGRKDELVKRLASRLPDAYAFNPELQKYQTKGFW